MTKQEKVAAWMEAIGFVYVEPKYTPSSSSWRKNGMSITEREATFFYDVMVEVREELRDWFTETFEKRGPPWASKDAKYQYEAIMSLFDEHLRHLKQEGKTR